MPEGAASGKNSPCVGQEGDVRLQAADTWQRCSVRQAG